MVISLKKAVIIKDWKLSRLIGHNVRKNYILKSYYRKTADGKSRTVLKAKHLLMVLSSDANWGARE